MDDSSLQPLSGRKRGHCLLEENDVFEAAIPPAEWKQLLREPGKINNVEIEAFKRLLEHPKVEDFIDWKDGYVRHERTMLIHAITHERYDIAHLLLDSGASVNISAEDGDTALMSAASNGDIDMTRRLVEMGADLHFTDSNGEDALMHAARDGYAEIVEYLIDQGADATHMNEDAETTALDLAAYEGHHEVVDLLLPLILHKVGSEIPVAWAKLMLNVGEELEYVGIEVFTAWMELPIARKLINWKDDRFADGKTMLHCAVCYGRLDVARLLVANGANVNISYGGGNSALKMASFDKDIASMRFLLEQGADIHHTNEEGDTALMWAFVPKRGCHFAEAAKLLLENGADIDAQNNAGKTVLHNACKRQDLEGIIFLIENGADQGIKDHGGMTPFHRACWKGRVEVAQFLLSRGANVNEKTARGTTPLQVASKANHLEIVWFLVRQYPGLVLEL